MQHPVFSLLNGGPSASAVRNASFGGGAGVTLGAGTGTSSPVAIAGTIENLYVNLASAPGAGTDYTIALNLNGVDQILTTTVADTNVTNSDTNAAHAIAVVPGDLLAWSITPHNTPATPTIDISCTFTGTTSGEANLSGSTAAVVAAATTSYWGTFGSTARTTEADARVTSPTGFVLDNLYVAASGSIGVGKTATFTLYLNGSPTLLSAQIVGAATTANDLFINTGHSVTVAAGDLLSMEVVAGAGTTSQFMKWGMRLTPTVDGEYPIMMATLFVSAVTRFVTPLGVSANNSTESIAYGQVPTAFTLQKMYATIEPAPGAAKTWTVKSRIDTGGGPGNGNLSATWTGAVSTGSSDTSNNDSLVAGSFFDWTTIPASGPAAVTKVMISGVSYIAPVNNANYWLMKFV